MERKIIVERKCNNKYDIDTLLKLLVLNQIDIELEKIKLDKEKQKK
jgi:phage tail sheath gpL-like